MTRNGPTPHAFSLHTCYDWNGWGRDCTTEQAVMPHMWHQTDPVEQERPNATDRGTFCGNAVSAPELSDPLHKPLLE